MEESTVCSLPGGFASVRKQFEAQQISNSHVTQFHFHHRTAQEMSDSELTISCNSRKVAPGSQQLHFNQESMASHSSNNVGSYDNHQNETEEEFPRYTTKELRDHFEKTIEQAAQSLVLPIKIEHDISQSKWSSTVKQNKTAISEVCETIATEAKEDTPIALVANYKDFPPPPAEDSDYLPPPPPDLLQMPTDSGHVTEFHYSPEPPDLVNLYKDPLNRKAYLKQRRKNELKRIYKHIRPEVLKNIEKEYCNDYVKNEHNGLDSQEYIYEDDKDEECVEWEEILPGDVQAMRWMFENKPLDTIKNETQCEDDYNKITEASNKGNWGRWLFKRKTLNSANEWGTSKVKNQEITGADVRKHCLVFETQPMDYLKDDSNARPQTIEEIIGGNVRSARIFFESSPQPLRKNGPEVGKLQKAKVNKEIKGDVRHQKWRFESQPLEHIREEKKEVTRTVNVEDDLTQEDGTSCRPDVRKNCWVFETQPMDTLKDDSNTQPMTKEEVIAGNVKSARLYFETVPNEELKELAEVGKLKKTVTSNEERGDVRHQKWRFESQPLEEIREEKRDIVRTIDPVEIDKVDVQNFKQMFESIDSSRRDESHKILEEGVTSGSVESSKNLFESSPLYALCSMQDHMGHFHEVKTVHREEVVKGDVTTRKLMFETRPIDQFDESIERYQIIKGISKEEIKSGDVKTAKCLFETQPLEEVHKGNVGNFKWLFENQSINTADESTSDCTVKDVQGGDVDKGRFIFETYSLDKIKAFSETDEELIKKQKIICNEDEKGNVRNYTIMFENQPLYAIQDKEGLYHKVTTVTSEEVTRGDVTGTWWLFETKPLDTIKDTDEVHIITSVTQQDVQKGDVTSAKWKFETQPLDRIAEEKKALIKTVDDIQGGNVRENKDRFESDALLKESFRTVNVSEIQKGDVRTAKWKFETQSIDKIRSMSSENLIETVKKEEVAKGDVKHSVWLFEKNPLDHIKEVDEDEDHRNLTQGGISKADVKTTTWFFETTPFDNFNKTKIEKTEIIGKSVKETLEELYSQEMVKSKGILIEADEIGDVRMAKYQIMNKQVPEIQREEVIRGDLQTVMTNLLSTQERKERQIVLGSEEKGNISSTVQQLFNQDKHSSIEKEEIRRGDLQEAINLFNEDHSAKHGILIQEDEKGDVQMSIYSLLNKADNVNFVKEDTVRGNIKSTLEKLSNSEKSDQKVKITVDAMEKGNVNFYSTCIESGALDYLKQLNLGPDDTPKCAAEKEKITGGDIEGTKLILGCNQTQIERTVEDVISGDVHKAVKVFMSEPTVSLESLQKVEIVKGDLRAALNSLSESANHTVHIEKEEVVKGNIPKALQCFERAQKHYQEVEKPDIIPGNIKETMKSLEKSAIVKDLVPGDGKATLKSLELAKQAVRGVEKEESVSGDIRTAMQSLQDACSEEKTCQNITDVQGDVRGTIQLLMEHPSSPKIQRSPSNVKGDVKVPIKLLYETQDQTQLEKAEVIKGDVKGTIKSLLETAQCETPKLRVYRGVQEKQNSPVKNLPTDVERNIQKIKTAKSVEPPKEKNSTCNKSEIITTKSSSMENSEPHSTTMVDHKTITLNHGIKTLKTEFRNLKSSPQGMIKVNKAKVQMYTYKPHVTEPDLPLPPPPPPVDDIDLPSPPPPRLASVDSDIDQFPPPPPPPPPFTSEPDFLPPPPSQQELESMPKQVTHPSPANAQKSTVKKVKGPALHLVPKLEPKVEFSKTQHVDVNPCTSEKMKMNPSKSKTTHTSKTVLREFPQPPESPKPLNEVCISPVKFTPPPSSPPFMRGPMSKFNTPLIKAEEKYRKLKEASSPTSTVAPIHDSVTVELEMLSNTDREQSANNMLKVMTTDTVYSDSRPCDSSKHVVISNATASNVSESHDKILTDSTILSSAKQKIASNEMTKVASIQRTSSASAVTQQMHTTTQKTVSVSSMQSAQSVKAEKVQTMSDSSKIEQVPPDRNPKNPKAKASNKSEEQMEDEMHADEIRIKIEKHEPAVTAVENVKSTKSRSETNDNAETELPKNPHTTPGYGKKKSGHSGIRDNASDLPIQTEKEAPRTNEKTGKPNHKVKRNSKQEKQVEIKTTNESAKHIVSQDFLMEVKEAVEVKGIGTTKEVKTAVKQAIKGVTPSPTAACGSAVPAAITDSQPETTTPSMKKNRSEKSKGGGQPDQGKESTESKADTVAQIRKCVEEEHVQIKTQVITTESNGGQNCQMQKAAKKQLKGSQSKKGTTVIQQDKEKLVEERRDIPITVTSELEQRKLLKSTTERKEESHRQDVQVLISNIKEVAQVSQTTQDSSVEEILLSTDPHWAMNLDRNCELEGSALECDPQKYSEILPHGTKPKPEPKPTQLENNETTEDHESELVSEKSVGGATPRISKISIGSAKIENQTKKKTSHERWKEEVSNCKSVDLQAPSPSLRLRSPSPTFITIESTRRTDSPQRVTPSPTLLHRPPTPPTPPPRRCDTPTSRLTRITPSPTFDRAEILPRLKDATAKLSRGVTPPPLQLPQQISEKKAEIVELPASFHRKIRVDSHLMDARGTLVETEKPKKSSSGQAQADVNSPHVKEDQSNISEGLNSQQIQNKLETLTPRCENLDLGKGADISEPSSATVKEKREFFEKAQKAEHNKTYMQKAPIDISERLGPYMEEYEAENKNKDKDELPKADLCTLVNTCESSEENFYLMKDLISLTEWLKNDAGIIDSDKEKADILEQEIQSFDIQAIKNVFELGEQSFSMRVQKRDQEEPTFSQNRTREEVSKQQRSQETKGGSQRSNSEDKVETVTARPTPGLTKTNSITGHFSNADQFGNKVTGTRSPVSEHSESLSTQPFSYADVVKRKAVRQRESCGADATEKLLRNFHQMWAESETVFDSLGYTVSEETTSQVVSRQRTTLSSDANSNEEKARLKVVKARVPKSELCTVCQRRAYPMDALIVDKKKYHKSCFCCEHCRNKLSLRNYVSLHGHFYCLPHYKQLLKSKWNHDNELNHKPPTGSAATTCDVRPQCNKISVVWPPQTGSPKKAFKIEEDIQLTKPKWPPQDNSTQIPTQKGCSHEYPLK